MIYFKPIPITLEELKKMYKQLSRKHHPDVGGSEDSMKLINSEYTELFQKLKNIHTDSNGNIYHKESKETPEQLIILMNQLFKAQKYADSAQEDFYEAECTLQNMDGYSYNLIWDLCYQAAKKFIIALLVFKNVRFSKEDTLLDLADICEKYANIDLSFIYDECAKLSDSDNQVNDYDGYYIDTNNSKRILKYVDKIEFFVTSYFDGLVIGNIKEKFITSGRKYLPSNKIKKE